MRAYRPPPYFLWTDAISMLSSSRAGPNALDPGRMTPDERLAEIAEILALGLMRLRARKSSPLSRDHGESSLDFSPDQRGHVPALGLPEDAS